MTPQVTVSPRPVSRLCPLYACPFHLDLAIVVEGHGVLGDDQAHVVALVLSTVGTPHSRRATGSIGAPRTSVAPRVALSSSMAHQSWL